MDSPEDQGVGLGRFLQLAFVAVVLFGCVHMFACESIRIPTASMAPTIPVGTYAYLDKLTYRLEAPSRGDIIVFQSPVDPSQDLVKRVIAIGGDTVELRDKKVFLNGAELVEHYVQHTRSGEQLVGDSLDPLTVPAGRLFVLGDNRDESDDSSVWKDKTGTPAPFLPVENVRGIVRGFF